MYLQAPVASHEPLEKDIFLLRLRAPAVAEKAHPGQFVMLRMGGGAEPLLARPFSICAVEDDEVMILYRVVGRGTARLSRIAPGTELGLWGPLGRGFDLGYKRPALVAGGLGLPPLIFAARRLHQAGAEPGLLLGLATINGFARLAARLGGLAPGVHASLATEDGSAGHHGLATELLQTVVAASDGVLACGPLPMLHAVAAICQDFGSPCQVSLEAPMACGVGACLGCALPASGGGYLHVCQEGPVVPAARVDWGRL